MTKHHLARVLDEVAPQALSRLEDFARNNGHSNGHRLTTYLRRNFLASAAAKRVLPAIEGLRKMGHHTHATRLEVEFSDWLAQCARLADSCPKTFPADPESRRQFIDDSVQQLRTQILQLASIAYRAAQDAGFDPGTPPVIGAIYSDLFGFRASLNSPPLP